MYTWLFSLSLFFNFHVHVLGVNVGFKVCREKLNQLLEETEF